MNFKECIEAKVDFMDIENHLIYRITDFATGKTPEGIYVEEAFGKQIGIIDRKVLIEYGYVKE